MKKRQWNKSRVTDQFMSFFSAKIFISNNLGGLVEPDNVLKYLTSVV